ncbi:unnamed protein product [Urochloa humidicola]
MKGDHHRYLDEFKTGAEDNDAVGSTIAAYQAAQILRATGEWRRCWRAIFLLHVVLREKPTRPASSCCPATTAASPSFRHVFYGLIRHGTEESLKTK